VEPLKVTLRKVQPRDWSESWKRHFKPMEFGKALLVKPTWSRKRPSTGQQLVLLDPGLSFGTGQHATTRFCLESLVSVRKSAAAQSFCDMGTGSGILAIAAVKLGYEPVDAFDFDPDCVRIAHENSELNQVVGRLQIEQADLTKLPKKGRRQYDVVCANLIYDLLLAEQARILARLKPGGYLVLAGILATQFNAVAKAYRAAGLRLVADKTEREWRSGLFLNPGKSSSK
jgi:ribosomal protein L11 methyltransferase